MIRYSNKKDLKKLYKNKYFKWIKLQTQSLEADNKLIDKLFIIEGERI